MPIPQVPDQDNVSGEQLAEWHTQGKMKYQVINVVARRARQINAGERPVIATEQTDPSRIALKELQAERLQVVSPPEPEEQEYEDLDI